MASEEMRVLENETIPAALAELANNQQTVQQIAAFCRDAYLAPPQPSDSPGGAAGATDAAKDAEVFAA